MRNLLKTDLKRILKDKLFMVASIIAVAFALLGPILYKVLFSALDLDGMLGTLVDAKTLFFNSFMPGDNFGLVLPILILIVLCKDFNGGTIRNKIISGKTRCSIFLSMFISSAVIMCAVMLAHAILTLLFSLVFFDFSSDPFTFKTFLFMLLSVFFEMLVYVFVAALASFLCTSMKNTGLSIVMYIAISFVLALFGGIISAAFSFASPENKVVYGVLEFLSSTNIFTSTLIGSGSSYSLKEIVYILLPCVIGSALLVLFGILIFKKKDLK